MPEPFSKKSMYPRGENLPKNLILATSEFLSFKICKDSNFEIYIDFNCFTFLRYANAKISSRPRVYCNGKSQLITVFTGYSGGKYKEMSLT